MCVNETTSHDEIIGNDASEEAVLMKDVCVLNEQGLHARPAAKLAQEAQRFDADIRLKLGAQEADAKSILDILSLAAAQGCGMTLQAVGADAEDALSTLSVFFENRLGEEA